METGFSGFKEINRVYFDPDQITVKEMIKALKKAGTYRGIKKRINDEDSYYSRDFTVFSVAGPYMNASGTMLVVSISNQPEG